MSEKTARQVNLDLWKTKAEAASMLNCSEKTIERYAEKGQLARKSRRVPGRVPLPVFSPDDLERIQKESIQTLPASGSQSLALRGARGDLAGFLADLRDLRESFRSEERKLTEDRLMRTMPLSAPAPPAAFLTIPEAATHSGLTETYLRRKIQAGELPAFKDRGWKVRRADLDKL